MSVKTRASSGINLAWDSIDWAKAQEYVKKLQMRIVKAVQEGRRNKAKSLQWLLTHSFYAKALAVKKVTENKGKQTSGVDRELWKTPKSKFDAISKLTRRGYRPMPLRRIYIPKKNGKMRPLSIPTMTDRAMQTLYKFALEPIAEATADPNSYGFRAERCVQDAIEQCFCCLAKTNSPKWVLEGDIKGCFDNISHEWILENIPMDRQVLEKWLKCGFVETKHLCPTEKGTPQGGTISPTICNMVLDGMERALRQNYFKTSRNGRAYTPKVNLVRYADDFIVTGESKEILENGVLPLIREFLAQRGLELSEEKTLITHIEDGFDFLGCNVRAYDGKLLIKPSKANTKAFLERVRTIIKRNPAVKQEDLIRTLNPVIDGWANFHRHNVSAKVFSTVDHQIWKALWQWARRRHKKKGKKWVAAKYFHRIGTRSWTFCVPTKQKMDNGEAYYLKLAYATDKCIVRFPKIKSGANPFDADWQDYFEERETAKMCLSIKGRATITRLFHKQKGVCPACGKRITSQDGFCVQTFQPQDYRSKALLHSHCRVKNNPFIFSTADP